MHDLLKKKLENSKGKVADLQSLTIATVLHEWHSDMSLIGHDLLVILTHMMTYSPITDTIKQRNPYHGIPRKSPCCDVIV